MLRNEGTDPVIPSAVPRVACREDGSYWSTGTAIGGATVECPRIAPQRNGIRERDSRRDGRVFFRALQYVRPINCVLSTPLLL